MLDEDSIAAVKIFGEASVEAMQTTGDMKRYAHPMSVEKKASFQGVSGWIPYNGRVKPGVESYAMTLKEAVYHAGAADMGQYRKCAVIVRLSERAKEIAKPHGIEVINNR
jgi:hypothetical protein